MFVDVHFPVSPTVLPARANKRLQAVAQAAGTTSKAIVVRAIVS
jgi:hypothetical protein